MRERADHCQLVALLCGSPKMLTQLDAGNIGVDSGKLSTDFNLVMKYRYRLTSIGTTKSAVTTHRSFLLAELIDVEIVMSYENRRRYSVCLISLVSDEAWETV